MTSITKTLEAPNRNSYTVAFYPSVDDNIHVAKRIGNAVKVSPWSTYAYQAFLLLNVIVFPAFLWFHSYWLFGLLIFVIEVVTLLFMTGRVDRDSYRDYYSQLYGNRENEIATVEVNERGITYNSDGGSSFWPWYRFTLIEETDESIYFFYHGNGFAVRKSGLSSKEDTADFVSFARRSLEMANRERIGGSQIQEDDREKSVPYNKRTE